MLTERKDQKLEVPIIVLPILKRNKNSQILNFTFGNQIDIKGGPNVFFGDERYKSYEIRAPLESVFVEASFLKDNYLELTGN